MKRAWGMLVACCMLVAAGCSTTSVPGGEDFYAQGQLLYSQHFYKGAIENYQHLTDQFPFSPYAEDAELKIGLSHYNAKQYAEASAALNDFTRMHPTSKNLELATYYLAMSNYQQISRPDRDQGHTETALAQFEALEQRFPESQFSSLAHQHIVVCRELLARQELLIGNFYFRNANFRAAESRLAELMAKYPDTPVAAQSLFELGDALEKEGKKYSAAQAFAALQGHYPKSGYARQAQAELKKLNQPVQSEDDPLEMVLAENGFGSGAGIEAGGGEKRVASDATAAPSPADGVEGRALSRPANRASDGQAASTPVTLRNVRLSSAEPPLSVIFDLSGPVEFDKKFDSGADSSSLTLHFDRTSPDAGLEHHLVFGRSIFKNCEIQADAQGTTITVNTAPVARFAIVPLTNPDRVLVTFTPRDDFANQSANAAF